LALNREFDVVVLGAGPAGLAAAEMAALGKGRVALLDENPEVGGQIWRATQGKLSPWARVHLRQLTHPNPQASPVAVISRCSIFDAPTPGRLLALTANGPTRIHYESLILATGARELFLPFPGWTLPGVFGAGGLQALVKSGLSVKNKNVVVAGSGPLILEVARYLIAKGANVRAVLEQTSAKRFLKFSFSAALHPSKAFQGLGILAKTRHALLLDSWIIAAHGERQLESVTIHTPKGQRHIPCDYLACAFGLVPNLELPRLIGCDVASGFINVDDYQRTTVENVYAAGELTGIGGTDAAIVQGRIAGASTTKAPHLAEAYFRKRNNTRRFTAALAEAFDLRPEVLQLPNDDTIICRCEDVTLGQLRHQPTARDAKLQTRCGMGPCQGRICGPVLQALLDHSPDTLRPPILPVPMSSLLYDDP
jgi:NADPH-dependent 2,4-dienoyl-CoA reductase/sulfur reductase-like enzyme